MSPGWEPYKNDLIAEDWINGTMTKEEFEEIQKKRAQGELHV